MTVQRPTVLAAGIGNVLRRDDGFGPAVARAVEALNIPQVRTVELGIGGVNLVHELMDGYEALVIIDAVDRGAPAGTLFVLEPEVPDIASMEGWDRREAASDMHQTVPEPALIMAKAAGVLPPIVRIIGCQPAEMDEMSMTLSETVSAAVPRAVEIVKTILNDWNVGDPTAPHIYGSP